MDKQKQFFRRHVVSQLNRTQGRMKHAFEQAEPFFLFADRFHLQKNRVRPSFRRGPAGLFFKHAPNLRQRKTELLQRSNMMKLMTSSWL